ncbi:M81 family metallopeptidase [Bosea sp. (in: a-proteobacteria)]|uniref:M81 family metallopeptidase n=1 Tax=Bosea sp. (in: a-proteobacteria) TaxID=1871050 RepID=UPI0026314B21|nr:M81 family metallopeptidase [Bosea sp. (in: a-proteobacteria)]MCO5092727.1 M81 family metallopeptidase [Bosea sp. (in: a-proteobacteria)]
MTLRIAFAGFNLESVTAVPQIVELAEFERVCVRGAALTERFRGTNTVPGGALQICEAQGAEFVPLFHTLLGALGPTADEAVAHYTAEIIDGVARSAPLDGVILFLHGACWAPSYRDVERHVIDALRAAAPSLPIAVALDYHGNIDRETLRGADIAVAYRHSPHIDMGETGERAARALLRLLRGGRRPGLAVARPDVVIPSIMSATALQPLASIIAEARATEAAGDCDISIMAGFSYADSANTGMSVICLDWAGQEVAQAKADVFSGRLRAARHAIAAAIPILGAEEALADIARRPAGGRPIVLLEHADRMNDSTHLLRLLLTRDVGRVNVPFLLDPETAAQAHEAGEGAEIAVRLAGKTAPETGGPLEAVARVIWSGPKSFTVSGRYQRGSFVDLGLTALLQIGRVRVSVVSHFAFAVDGDPFFIFGERPEDYDVILLRSKTHFRDYYEPMADRILVVDTPDLGPADVRLIPYRQLDTAGAYPWSDAPA